jgi:hypothetical protein
MRAWGNPQGFLTATRVGTSEKESKLLLETSVGVSSTLLITLFHPLSLSFILPLILLAPELKGSICSISCKQFPQQGK